MKIYHLTLLSVQLGDIKYIHNPPSSFKNYLFIYLLPHQAACGILVL